MGWADVLISAVVVALLVRLSAVTERDYWAIYQLLPAIAVGPALADVSLYAQVLGDGRTARRTAWRFGFALIPGAWLALRYDGLSLLDAGVPAALSVLLLIWPIVLVGWPPVANRTALVGLYAAVVVAFASISGLAYAAVEAASSSDSSGIVSVFEEWAGQAALAAAVALIASTLMPPLWRRLRPHVPWQ